MLARIISCVSALMLAGVALSGCAGSGPAGRDLISTGSLPAAPYALVDIDDRSIEIISRWHRPSLGAMFGDYRGAIVQRVNIGDSLLINIWEAGGSGIFGAPITERGSTGSRPASIPEQLVANDGTIAVPFAGRVRVAGKTTQQIEELIVKKLAAKASDPQVLVTLTRNISNSATVTGDVVSGARVALNTKGDRVLDVIATAGGIRVPVHEAFITVSRNDTTLSVPMQAILSNPAENVYIRPGDVVTVIRRPQSFTAVGATGHNAVVAFDAGGLTLEEAMGKAGGLMDERADPHGVFVLRYESVTLVQAYPGIQPHLLSQGVVPVAYRLNARDPSALFRARRFLMRDKDILYVSHAPITELEKVFRVVGQLAAPAATVATVRAINN